jgi:Co/Zn/Cd efflux system component
MSMDATNEGLRRVVRLVMLLNLGYFGVEFAVAVAIGSVSLFADSIDFLEDASINLLILVALGWGAVRRARVGMLLAAIILIPGLATLWTAWEKFNLPVAPDPVPLSLAGAGALAVNLTCALMLTRYRHHSGSLTRAAFRSARNDALANIAIIVTGFVTAYTLSAWPDLIVGLAIAAINAGAARQVWEAARQEHHSATNLICGSLDRGHSHTCSSPRLLNLPEVGFGSGLHIAGQPPRRSKHTRKLHVEEQRWNEGGLHPICSGR